MMTEITFLRYSLMYLGAVPFLSCAALMESDGLWMPPGLSLETILRPYALLIGAFMAGVHWGQHLPHAPASPKLMALFSNTVTLGFWFGFLLLPLHAYLLTSAGLFIVILMIDLWLARRRLLDKSYATHRVLVTGLVVASLVTVGWPR